MKKSLVLLAFAILLFPVLAMCQGYVGASIGQTDLGDEGFDKPTSYSIVGGYRLNDFFAIEATYVDFGKAEPDFVDPDLGLFLEASGFDVGAVGIFPVGNKFEVFARAGFMKWDVNAGSTLLPEVTVGLDGEDLNYGVGFAINFTDKFNLFGGYQRYRFEAFGESGDLDNLYLGARYYFGKGRGAKSR